jgi:hypothetical protein
MPGSDASDEWSIQEERRLDSMPNRLRDEVQRAAAVTEPPPRRGAVRTPPAGRTKRFFRRDAHDLEVWAQVVEIDELEDVTDMVDLALHASGLTGSEKQLRGLP